MQCVSEHVVMRGELRLQTTSIVSYALVALIQLQDACAVP
jgi:hypothetical protein